ncbi:MAG: putative tape measure protein [Prokaryotic dsDNA virus sp.]|nr:MAG: putative tape measure protein [Prokaryotic dsDNA virus sp.]|tara:strand:- start:2068 stop:4011 length:1944 start_codon:yes stop_codon:yes gene_type:complete
MAIQRLRVDLLLNSESFNKGLKTAEGSLKAFGSKMTTVGKSLSTRITLPLALAGGAAIKMASDFQESVNKVEVAFKGANGVVKDFAKTTLKQFGIAEGTALDMAALFGDMSTSMGLSVDSAAELSTSLVGLAGDLSSFKNMNIEQVTTALNGVFTGETESLKRLGIVMTQVNLEQFAMEQGITKSLKQMSQAEKVMLRYEFVMSKTKNAQGDFARTSEGAANQMRIFGESSKQLGQKLGSILLPFFTKLVAKGNDLIERFLNLDKKTQELVVAFGVVAAALPPLVLGIGLVATAFGKVTAAVRILTLAMAKNPLTALAIGITAIATASIEALHQLNPMVSRVTTLMNVIKSLGNPFKFQELQMLSSAKAAKIQSETTDDLKDKTDELSDSIAKQLKLQNKPKSKTRETVSPVSTLQTSQDFSGTGGMQRFRNLSQDERFAHAESMGIDVGPIKIDPQILKPLEVVKENASAIMVDVSDIILSGFTDIIMGVASGNMSLAGVFGSMVSMLGDVAIRVGKAALGIGKGMAAIQASFTNPVTAIAAGIALIAIGAAIKNFGGSFMGGNKGGSIPSFAKGGIVSAPTLALVGDNTGAGRGNPEVIAPLNKLQGMIDAKSNQQINVGGEFRLEGQDLVLALQRAGRERNRIN